MRKVTSLGVVLIVLAVGMNCTTQTPSTAYVPAVVSGETLALRQSLVALDQRLGNLENKVCNMERFVKSPGILGAGFPETPPSVAPTPSLDERVQKIEASLSTVKDTVHNLARARTLDQTGIDIGD